LTIKELRATEVLQKVVTHEVHKVTIGMEIEVFGLQWFVKNYLCQPPI